MLNRWFCFICLFCIMCFIYLLYSICFVCNAQDYYITYTSKYNRPHKIYFNKDTLILHVMGMGLFPKQNSKFLITHINDSLLKTNVINTIKLNEGIQIDDSLINSFSNAFIKIISENELLLFTNNNIYVRESTVKEIIGSANKLVIYNDSIIKDIEVIDSLLHIKYNKIMIYDGETSYHKYGIGGINGSIVISSE